MDKSKIDAITGSYHEWLIKSLQNKKEAVAYLQVALDEFEKDRNQAALLMALRNVAEACGLKRVKFLCVENKKMSE